MEKPPANTVSKQQCFKVYGTLLFNDYITDMIRLKNILHIFLSEKWIHELGRKPVNTELASISK